MPVAIRDETGAFIRQMAQGNEALAQLYTRLLAQYEERRMNEAHQKEMMGMRESITQDRIGAQNDEWYRRQEFAHNLRNPNGAPTGPNYLGPGAAGTPNPMAPGAAQPTAAPTSATPAARPSVYTIDNNPFSKGAGTGTPAAPAPQKTSMSGEAADAYAQAPPGAGHQDFSAQSRTKPLPTVEQPPRTPRKEPTDNTQLPTQPRVTARTAATRPQAHFLPIDQKWLDLMHQKEDEFKLPRGTLMTAYGLENGGGRQFGKNPRSSAEGIFQFTRELRDEYKLSDQDIYNPEKMIHAAAFNMRRNADILEQNYKVKLPLTPEAVPMFVGLHQWGSGAGPRIVAAYLQNPEAPMTKVMGTHKDRNGSVIPNYNVLANNGQNPNATVQDALKNKSAPHLNAYIQQFPDHANSPPGKYTSIPVPQPEPGAERQQATPQVGDPSAPRPPGNIPPQQHGTMGSHPRLVAAVRGGASVALPEGYTIRQTSGHRPGDSGYHGRGHAGDFQIYTPDGKPIPNRGEDTTGLYTKLARGVKTWVRENDPQLERAIGYGGAHGTLKGGGGVPDLMHYDLGGSRGRMRPEVQFARLQPLAEHERRQPSKVQVAGPMPAKEAPQRPPPAKGVSRTENYLYEPLGRPLKPSEQLPAKGQLPPTHFSPPSPSIAEFNPLSTSADAFKPTAAAAMREGITPPSKPAILGRSGGPTFDTPMPQPRPDTESGDLEYGSPSQPLAPDPNFADSADSTLLNVLPKPSPEPHVRPDTPLNVPQDMAPDEAKNVPDAPWLAPDERLNVPIEAIPDLAPDESKNVPDDGLSALNMPMPLNNASTTTQPDVPDIQYPDAAGANASEVGGPNVSALQSQPQPLPPTSGWQARRAYNANTPRRLPWTAIKEDVPAALGGIKDAIFAIPGAIKGAGSHIAGNASMLRQDVGRGAGAVADTAQDAAGVAGNVAGAYNTMQNSRQQSLEELGAAIRDRYTAYKDAVNSNVPTIDAARKPSLMLQPPNPVYNRPLPPVPNEPDDTPVDPQVLKKRISDALFNESGVTPQSYKPDYEASYNKIMEWVKQKMEGGGDTPATPTAPKPPVAAKPAAPTKAAPAADPNVFVPPKMMPDGVTPWLANEAGAPKTGPLHHIKPKKKGPEDLLDITGQPPAAGSSTPSDIPPAPGTRPVMPNADVGVKMMPSGRFKATLEPVPVDDIAPVEPE